MRLFYLSLYFNTSLKQPRFNIINYIKSNTSNRFYTYNTRTQKSPDYSKLLLNESVQLYFDNISKNLDVVSTIVPSLQLEYIKKLINSRNEILQNLKELKELSHAESDNDFKSGVKEECELNKSKLLDVEANLLEALLPTDDGDDYNEIVLEVSAGVGGQEAMLFANNLFDMYVNHVEYKGWNYTVAENDHTDMGGLRFGSILIEGIHAFKYLQFESGVHRVQRIPITERSGRVHTSTAAVAVMPQPREIDIEIRDKDLRIETMRATGAGGQHVNKTDSAVRIVHIPSGLTVECQTERSQIKNKSIALKRLKAKMFQIQYESQTSKMNNLRKSLVGSSARSDKVRTYNFNQDRITDHRLSTNFYNVKGFLEGNRGLDLVLDHLLELSDQKRIEVLLKSISNKNK